MSQVARFGALFVGGLLALSMAPSASAAELGISPKEAACLEDGLCLDWREGFNFYLCTSATNCTPLIHESDGGCRIVEPYGTNPALSTDPLLGLVVVDPEGCAIRWGCHSYFLNRPPEDWAGRCLGSEMHKFIEFVITGVDDLSPDIG